MTLAQNAISEPGALKVLRSQDSASSFRRNELSREEMKAYSKFDDESHEYLGVTRNAA